MPLREHTKHIIYTTSGQSIANVKVVMGYNINKSTRKKMNYFLKSWTWQ